MKRLLSLVFLFFFFVEILSAQNKIDSNNISRSDTIHQTDSVVKRDSVFKSQVNESFSKRPKYDSGWMTEMRNSFSREKFSRQILKQHPYFGFRSTPISIQSSKKVFKGKEALFYFLISLLLVFAFFRQFFYKYFNDLFRVFFRTTLKQKQIREQLMQTPLPSLLLNSFFLVSAALYIDFLLQHFKLTPVNNFWLLFLYCGVGLSAIYLCKFLGLKFSGWVFNMREATDAYIFIIFIVNKVIGIFLIPFLILLAFTQGNIYIVALAISWCGVGILLAYRFILSFSAVRNQIRVNLFHFILYISAFEVVPLLLIWKALFFFFR